MPDDRAKDRAIFAGLMKWFDILRGQARDLLADEESKDHALDEIHSSSCKWLTISPPAKGEGNANCDDRTPPQYT